MASEQELAPLLDILSRELGEDAHNLHRVQTAVRRLAGQPSLGAHAAILLALTGLQLEEDQAAQVWERARERAAQMAEALLRPVPLRAALLDVAAERNLRSLSPWLLDIRGRAASRGAGIDPVTGLLDAEALGAHLQREVQRAKRFRTGFSCLAAALDDLPALLHNAGDDILTLVERETGMMITNAVRDIDPAARVHPGHFAVILPETDRTGAFLAADRLRRRIARHFQTRSFPGGRTGITVSVGVSCYPEDGSFGAEVMRRAEQALLHARSRGVDRISVHYRDRREFIRIDVDPSRLGVQVVERGQPAAPATTVHQARNISPEGVLFETPQPLAVGQEVSVVCNNLQEIDQIIVPGRVVRIEEFAAEDGSLRYEVGLAFDLQWEHQLLEILEFLDRYRNPEPEKG